MAEPILSNSESKICEKCGAEKVSYPDKRYPSKPGNWRCKPCYNSAVRERYHQNLELSREKSREAQIRYRHSDRYTATRREYYQQNKKRLAEYNRSPERKQYQRQYSQRNAEHLKEYRQNYFQENRERLQESPREYYQQNAEAAKVKAAEWARNNQGRRKDICRKHAENNPEKLKAAKQKWAKGNPEYCRAKCVQRRARKAAVANTLTLDEWIEIQLRYDHRCAYCGEKKKLTMDHVMPISKGGGHTADNIVPACQPCNSRKWTGPPPVPIDTFLP